MRRTTLFIHGQGYRLDAAVDAEALKGRIVDALRVGGDFVTFTSPSSDEVTVLISPGTAVTLHVETVPETSEHEETSGTPGGSSSIIDDFDWTDY